MDFKTLQGFDEKYARVTVKTHKTFDGKVYDVLYGAFDADNHPVAAKAVGEDGCGRWLGIESNGKTQMFIWQHPQCDGGALEYGTDEKENALEVMENTLKDKMDLCKQIDALANEGNADNKEKFDELIAQFDAMKDWATAKDVELKERLNRAKERFETKVNRISDRVSQKEGLIATAKELVESTNWKATREAFEHLHDEWNEIGNAGEKESELWKTFNSIRREFDNKRREYFDNLDAKRAEAVEKKEAIIASAKEVLNEKNFKVAGDKMKQLMDDWKAAGFAGKEKGDELWEKFSEIRKNFFDSRSSYYEELEKQYAEAIAKKEALIVKANEITQLADFSKDNTNVMKDLDKQWKEAGFAGAKRNEDLWEQFKSIKEVFWDGKHADTQKRFKEMYAKKEELLNSQREQLNRLEEDVYATDNLDEVHDIERQISRKKEFIAQLKEELESLDSKITKEESAEPVVAEDAKEESVEPVVTEETEEAEEATEAEVTEETEA